MGIESSAPQKLDLWDGTNHIINEKQITHRLYGENVKIFVSEAHQDQKYALITKNYPDEHSYDRQKQQAEFIKEFDNKYIVKLINYSSDKVNSFCSSFWEQKFLFEFLDNDLENDFKLRIKYYNKHYEENELFYIGFSVIQSLSFMQSRGIIHGDICPSNILIDFEGKIKLMPNKIIITQNNLMYMLGIDAYRCYLSPKQLEIMKTKDKNIQHDINKCDLFSLGVILMEAALLKNMNELYYKKIFELNVFKIQLNLKKIKEKYSEQLSNFIQLLLNQDEQERPSAQEFVRILEDQHLKGLDMAIMLYSMNELMKDPINLLINPPVNNQLSDMKKSLIDIKPITHSNQDELILLENNDIPYLNIDLINKEENKSDLECQNRTILDDYQKSPIKDVSQNNEQIVKQKPTLSELRANLQNAPSQTQIQNEINNQQYFQQQQQQQFDSRNQQQNYYSGNQQQNYGNQQQTFGNQQQNYGNQQQNYDSRYQQYDNRNQQFQLNDNVQFQNNYQQGQQQRQIYNY